MAAGQLLAPKARLVAHHTPSFQTPNPNPQPPTPTPSPQATPATDLNENSVSDQAIRCTGPCNWQPSSFIFSKGTRYFFAKRLQREVGLHKKHFLRASPEEDFQRHKGTKKETNNNTNRHTHRRTNTHKERKSESKSPPLYEFFCRCLNFQKKDVSYNRQHDAPSKT